MVELSVLQWLKQRGEHGVTYPEACAELGEHAQLLFDLRTAGYVIDSGRRRPHPEDGSDCAVLIVRPRHPMLKGL